jgi:hypothetical protein
METRADLGLGKVFPEEPDEVSVSNAAGALKSENAGHRISQNQPRKHSL